MVAVEQWDGDDWEQYCLLLMRRCYGADQVQEVPAKHGGDLGIEAFTFDGHAVQCYAVQEPVSTAERYNKQRDKLTTDLAKLKKNQKDLLKLLGSVRIQRYMFMVPIWDSHKIVQHASQKATEYRQLNLPHLHEDFQIVVVTDDAFAEQRNQVLSIVKDLVPLDESSPTEVATWISQNVGHFQTAEEKVAIVEPDANKRAAILKSLVTQHINGENSLSALRDRYPDCWEAIRRYVNQKEAVLVLEYPSMSTGGLITLPQLAKDLESGIGETVPSVGSGLARGLAWSSIADWIMRCPLRFEG